MRTLTESKRNRKVINVTHKEFLDGKWLLNLPDNNLLEVEYKRSARIIVIKWAEIINK